jgi:glycogen synthase
MTQAPPNPTSPPTPTPAPWSSKQYGPENHKEGKAAARKELRRRLGLADVDVPIVSVVTRLVHQKGIHLIKHAAWRTLERGGQFVLLGSAPDGRVQVGLVGLVGLVGRGGRGHWLQAVPTACSRVDV